MQVVARRAFLGLSLSAGLVACAGASPPRPVLDAQQTKPAEPQRGYGLYVPAFAENAHAALAVPLVVVLHGYSIDGAKEVRMLRMDALARTRGFALAYPDGTKDQKGYRFWNATDACCNWSKSAVDDVAYLDAMIDEIASKHAIDRKRVYLVGHSNGAFMAHRFACERAGKVAAIATLAGVPWKDEARCTPSEPVSVLHMQGTKDPFIVPGGGRIDENPAYPSAEDTVRLWARRNQCLLHVPAASGQLFDFDRTVPGAETTKHAFGICASNSTVELWTLAGSNHEPDVSDAYATAIYDFLLAHPKP